MYTKIIKIAIPSLLLLLAMTWVLFGSNFFNDGYGLHRDKVVNSPGIVSTRHDYASIEDLKGHMTYLTFGFSHCAGNCPFTLSQFTKLASVLPDDVRLVFVSIDNERDDIEHLKRYLANINPDIIGWRIDDGGLQKFAEQFQTFVRVKEGEEPEHSSAIQLLDKEGRWVRSYPYLNLNKNAMLKDYQAFQQKTQSF